MEVGGTKILSFHLMANWGLSKWSLYVLPVNIVNKQSMNTAGVQRKYKSTVSKWDATDPLMQEWILIINSFVQIVPKSMRTPASTLSWEFTLNNQATEFSELKKTDEQCPWQFTLACQLQEQRKKLDTNPKPAWIVWSSLRHNKVKVFGIHIL